jgi:hypothetical protein
MPMPRKKADEGNQDYLLRCTNQLVGEGAERREAFQRCAANFGVEFSPDAALFNTTVTMHGPEVLEEGQKPEDAPRSFLISAKTADPVDRWYGRMIIDIDGMRTEPKLPILRSHDHDRVVGSGGSFKDADHLYIEGDFSKVTEDAKEVLDLADEGFPWQASIGVWAEEVFFVEAGASRVVNGMKVEGPIDVWTKSYVREVSFVTLGADSRTAAIALTNETGAKSASQPNSTEVKPMNLEQLKKDHLELFEEVQQSGVVIGIGQERARVTQILEAGGDADVTVQLINDGTEPADAFKAFFEAEKQKRGKGLNELEAGATPPQGQDLGQGDGTGSGDGDQREFMEIAREIKDRDKCTMAVAMKKAVREYPDAHKKFLQANHKAEDDGRS